MLDQTPCYLCLGRECSTEGLTLASKELIHQLALEWAIYLVHRHSQLIEVELTRAE